MCFLNFFFFKKYKKTQIQWNSAHTHTHFCVCLCGVLKFRKNYYYFFNVCVYTRDEKKNEKKTLSFVVKTQHHNMKNWFFF